MSLPVLALAGGCRERWRSKVFWKRYHTIPDTVSSAAPCRRHPVNTSAYYPQALSLISPSDSSAAG